MAKTNYAQYLLFAVITIFVIIGIANYGATPSGYSTRYDVTVYECKWDNGWQWIGETHDYTWKLGYLLSRTEAYCNDGTWTCKKVDGTIITGVADCSYDTEGSICTCIR